MITVLTTGRSASNWYCDKLATENNYQCLFEVLETSNTYLKYFLKYKNKKDVVVKLIPYQFGKTYTQRHINILENSERVVFLLRRDYKAQMRSSFAGSYAKKEYGLEFHDEFENPITIPSEYIKTHWQSQIDIFLESFRTIEKLYREYQRDTVSVTYTEDEIQVDNNKLNRPFIFETDLWYPEIDYSVFEI